MICLTADGISLSFGAVDILKGISFSLQDGDRLGIVGVNGAGKSSLLKILTGEMPATNGNVYLAKNKSVRFLRQSALDGVAVTDAPVADRLPTGGTVLSAMLSVFDDLIREEAQLDELRQRIEAGESDLGERYATLHEQFTEAGGYSFRGRCKGLLRSLGFSPEDEEKPLEKLSGGEQTRLALGRVLYAEPDLLILDEPTNHLDRKTLTFLENFLRDYRNTVIVFSHYRYFLDRVTTKILNIEHGKGRMYDGNYSVFTEKKKKDREIQERHYKNQQREIARIEAYIEQQRRWNRERNIIAAESRQKQLDKMEREERPEALPDVVRLSFGQSYPSGEDVLTVKRLKKGFASRTLFEDLSFEVKKGDRLLIVGDNGCGKSTLLKILMGLMLPTDGMYRFGYNVKAGYYDQANQNLRESSTVLDELWDAFATLTQTEVRSALALLGFTGDDVLKEVRNLSGGERARLTLAKLSLSKTNLLILDEPTNHLDIETREVLEEALMAYEGTVIAVSHDRYFIRRLATKLLDFRGGTAETAGKAEDKTATPSFFDGTYEEYLQYLERVALTMAEAAPADAAPASGQPMTEAKAKYLQGKRSQAEIRKKRTRLREVKARCTAIEQELEEISAKCEASPSDHLLLAELYARQETLEEELLTLYEESEALENELGNDT